MSGTHRANAEAGRLAEDARRTLNWTRWGPYLSERQWATVREDYSADGMAWDYFPHDHARSRAYRWGEDGLLGITDRECRLCFALALWNGRDPILKERLFGVTGTEGNHGEDVKEEYFYLDATPTSSYLKALYKYPQAEFPYARLVAENRHRGMQLPEFELVDTEVFDERRYFDVYAEYAKHSPNDLLIRITVTNWGPETAVLQVLPTLWFHNTWSWGCTRESCSSKPRIALAEGHRLTADHESLGRIWLEFDADPDGRLPPLLFTDNETNYARLYGKPNDGPFAEDGFHEYVIRGRADAVNPKGLGSKAAPHYRLEVPSGQARLLRLRLYAASEATGTTDAQAFDQIFARRLRRYGVEILRALHPNHGRHEHAGRHRAVGRSGLRTNSSPPMASAHCQNTTQETLTCSGSAVRSIGSNTCLHGETGKGLGASHQTGWTALVIRHLEDLARQRR